MIEIHELVIQARVADLAAPEPSGSVTDLSSVSLDRLTDQVTARVFEALRRRNEGLASWD